MRGTWIGASGEDGLGVTDLSLSTSFSMPGPDMKSFISISPGLNVQYLDGPEGVPLPSEVFNASLTFSWMKPINERMTFVAGVSPGYASDLNAGGSDAFRLVAFGSLIWQTTETTKWTLGVAATGREDIPILPAAGVIWTPTPDWQIDIGAPRPRVARRIAARGTQGDDWIYAAGEFGGGTWAVDRGGVEDELTIRDFRLVLGWERKGKETLNPRFEMGYVFGRKIEYESDDYDFSPGDSLMLRTGITF
ncbi:DUF6268 family outer membrane beta-barrel protein [Rubinisphaera margarita]|uniref:DUF6268 family outer membrane beta-barrel protein n=1 Tax=Rubinisphaera margarita TaxID=2909586 RepID=UPI001EE873CB|nr:DUF6268 family outer membrane beta-barrel protein [Rubinisphaera margarita]MCG6156343.1 DUF6268 family outer membrane beta-barrel protein [Rubinisphaera margarita]